MYKLSVCTRCHKKYKRWAIGKNIMVVLAVLDDHTISMGTIPNQVCKSCYQEYRQWWSKKKG